MKSKAQYVIPPTNMTYSSLFLKYLNNIEAFHSLFTNVLELMTCHIFISIFNEGFQFGSGNFIIRTCNIVFINLKLISRAANGLSCP